MIECVFFDAGNTLIYPRRRVGEAYAGALRARGVEVDADEVELEFARTWRRLRAQRGSCRPPYGATAAEARRWWREVVVQTFERFGPPHDTEGAFEELWAYFASPAAWRLYTDALATIERLKARGLSVGLISNWDARLVPVLRELGVWERLDAAAISFQVGAEKPDERIFAHALAQCRVAPWRALHVGDSYEEDVLGARAAGLHALWLRRDGTSSRGRADAPAIRTLDEVLARLDGEGG